MPWTAGPPGASTLGTATCGTGTKPIRLLDAATRDLSGVRSVLVGQLRADEDERAGRVDHLLADLKAGRDGVSDWSGGHEPTRDGGDE
jgi:hypothetical protein